MNRYSDYYNAQVLTLEEIAALIEEDSDSARNKLFNHHINLVNWYAWKYKRKYPHMEMEDLIQEGMIGLWRAIQKYDPDRNTKLTTYASWWIRALMNRAGKRHMKEDAPWDEDQMALIPDPKAEAAFSEIDDRDYVRDLVETISKLPDGDLLLKRVGLWDETAPMKLRDFAEEGVNYGLVYYRINKVAEQIRNGWHGDF